MTSCDRRGLGLLLSGLLVLTLTLPAAAETRSFAMSKFWPAMNSQDGDCPKGVNPRNKEQYARNLALLGISPQEIAKLIENASEGYEERSKGGWDQNRLGQLMNNRGRIDGKPVNAYVFPMTVADPHLNTPETKFAYGFNLDGKGPTEKSFIDPESREEGVDNELVRVLGCTEPMRGRLREGSAFWLFDWMAVRDSSPAWIFSVTGDDLSKDGPVTIEVGRAMEITKFNGNGTARAGMTFRKDPDPRVNGNIYKGQIKDGIITVTEPRPLHLIQDQLLFPVFTLDKFHMRLSPKPDGTVDGIIGGYQPIEEVYFPIAQGNYSSENAYEYDTPGLYHLLRKYADANPDAKTGQNWSISVAYYIEAVAAHVVPAKPDRAR